MPLSHIYGGYGIGGRDRRTPTSVSEMMDPALSRDRLGGPMNITQALGAGWKIGQWGKSSGVGPGTRGYQGSAGQQPLPPVPPEMEPQPTEEEQMQMPPSDQRPQFHTKRPAGEIHGAMTGSQYYQKASMLGRGLRYAHGTKGPGPIPWGQPFIAGDAQEDGQPNEELILPTPQGMEVLPLKDIPRHADGTRPHRHTGATPSAAGRQGGLSPFYDRKNHLAMERGARAAIDEVTGLSQTPTEREISDYLGALAAAGKVEEAGLLQKYFHAKTQGGAALAQAIQDVQHYRGTQAALQQQRERQQPSPGLAAQAGFAPQQSIGAQVGQPPAASAAAIPWGKAPGFIPGLSDRPDPAMNRSITTPYGTGSVTTAPRSRAAVFNTSDTYDPTFAEKKGIPWEKFGEGDWLDEETLSKGPSFEGDKMDQITHPPVAPEDVPQVVSGRSPVPPGYSSDLAYELSKGRAADFGRGMPPSSTSGTTAAAAEQPSVSPAWDFARGAPAPASSGTAPKPAPLQSQELAPSAWAAGPGSILSSMWSGAKKTPGRISDALQDNWLTELVGEMGSQSFNPRLKR